MQLDFQRYECKYLIPARLCDPIGRHIACYTQPDAFMARGQRSSYLITSLYLDTPNMQFHYAKHRKDLNRLKLRIRTYGSTEGPAVFFEIKRKINGVIFKRRVRIAREDWAQHVDGGPGLFEAGQTGRDAEVVAEFLRLMAIHCARPAVLVRYRRKAFQGIIDDYARVTFDTELQWQPARRYQLHPVRQDWRAIDDPETTGMIRRAVVLELKFANQAPRWMVDLVERFSLRLRGFSKYSTSVQQLLDGRLAEPYWRTPLERSIHEVHDPAGAASRLSSDRRVAPGHARCA